jgi:hypothetical protein
MNCHIGSYNPGPMRIQAAGLLWLAIAWCVCPAQSAKEYAGTWVLPIQGKNLMVLRLEPGHRGWWAKVWHRAPVASSGSLARPMRFTSDGTSVWDIAQESVTEPIVQVLCQKGLLIITVEKPNDPSDKDKYQVSLTPDGHALVRPNGGSMTPWRFHRADHAAMLPSGWDSARSYSLEDEGTSDPEMASIFEADQKAREGDMTKIDWRVVSEEDAQRRVAVRELLEQDKLHTGEDFERAAFIFQHSDTPDDFLLAHTLAMVAVARGRVSALWIGAATLDRYLQNIQQPQIYGTQFTWKDNAPTTQDPYHRELISDSLRRALGVPPMAQQEERRKEIEASRHVPAPKQP